MYNEIISRSTIVVDSLFSICQVNRPPINYPVDDDTAWKRETTAQRRVRSLTLKIPNSDGSLSATPALSQAELDLAAQKRSQLRRQYRRLALVAEQQRIATRRLHIV